MHATTRQSKPLQPSSVSQQLQFVRRKTMLRPQGDRVDAVLEAVPRLLNSIARKLFSALAQISGRGDLRNHGNEDHTSSRSYRQNRQLLAYLLQDSIPQEDVVQRLLCLPGSIVAWGRDEFAHAIALYLMSRPCNEDAARKLLALHRSLFKRNQFNRRNDDNQSDSSPSSSSGSQSDSSPSSSSGCQRDSLPSHSSGSQSDSSPPSLNSCHSDSSPSMISTNTTPDADLQEKEKTIRNKHNQDQAPIDKQSKGPGIDDHPGNEIALMKLLFDLQLRQAKWIDALEMYQQSRNLCEQTGQSTRAVDATFLQMCARFEQFDLAWALFEAAEPNQYSSSDCARIILPICKMALTAATMDAFNDHEAEMIAEKTKWEARAWAIFAKLQKMNECRIQPAGLQILEQEQEQQKELHFLHESNQREIMSFALRQMVFISVHSRNEQSRLDGVKKVMSLIRLHGLQRDEGLAFQVLLYCTREFQSQLSIASAQLVEKNTAHVKSDDVRKKKLLGITSLQQRCCVILIPLYRIVVEVLHGLFPVAFVENESHSHNNSTPSPSPTAAATATSLLSSTSQYSLPAWSNTSTSSLASSSTSSFPALATAATTRISSTSSSFIPLFENAPHNSTLFMNSEPNDTKEAILGDLRQLFSCADLPLPTHSQLMRLRQETRAIILRLQMVLLDLRNLRPKIFTEAFQLMSDMQHYTSEDAAKTLIDRESEHDKRHGTTFDDQGDVNMSDKNKEESPARSNSVDKIQSQSHAVKSSSPISPRSTPPLARLKITFSESNRSPYRKLDDEKNAAINNRKYRIGNQSVHDSIHHRIFQHFRDPEASERNKSNLILDLSLSTLGNNNSNDNNIEHEYKTDSDCRNGKTLSKSCLVFKYSSDFLNAESSTSRCRSSTFDSEISDSSSQCITPTSITSRISLGSESPGFESEELNLLHGVSVNDYNNIARTDYNGSASISRQPEIHSRYMLSPPLTATSECSQENIDNANAVAFSFSFSAQQLEGGGVIDTILESSKQELPPVYRYSKQRVPLASNHDVIRDDGNWSPAPVADPNCTAVISPVSAFPSPSLDLTRNSESTASTAAAITMMQEIETF